MKSKIDVRVFAVEQAVKIMGVGTPQKDVVAKAQEIEKYIIGAAELPEIAPEASPIDYLNSVASLIGGNANAEPAAEPVKSK
jgi:hypothetical protein